MAQSSGPSGPPRIAPSVTAEAIIQPILMGALATLVWNYAVAPFSGLPTVNIATTIGLFIVLAQVCLVVGLQVGYGLARRTLAEQEEYGRQAAAWLDEIGVDDDELEPPLHTPGGQG